jgi:hypothetical protein
MRSHGVTTFPDPTVSSGSSGQQIKISGSGIGPNSPTFQAAQEACRRYAPSATATSAQSAQNAARQLKFAECMRSHGVPNFPDPSDGGFDLSPSLGIDTQSATFKAADAACGNLVPVSSGS